MAPPRSKPNAPLTRETPVDAPEPLESTPTPVTTPPAPSETRVEASPLAASTQTVSLVSELDSYILERMKGQPQTMADVEARVEALSATNTTRHRLVLPEFFEGLSADCTWQHACPFHKEGRVGRLVFRWLFKDKRALDRAMNVVGWSLVNRALFPAAPRELFAVSGAVELGDSVLAFLPARRAQELRDAPPQRSQELIHSRMTKVTDDYVLMTGNPKDERFYKPDLPPESVEAGGAVGVAVEGQDF